MKIGSASWRSCCSPGFWKQSACYWQVLRTFWPYCCQENSSLPEQMPFTLPVPLRSLSFRTLDLWSEDRQRCQLSTSPWSIPEKPSSIKWRSHHPCPEPWWTAWLSRAWCAAGEEYSVSVHQRIVDDVPFFIRHQFLLQRPALLRVMLSTVPTSPHVQKTWILDEARLLSQQKVHHLQVNTNKPPMLIITNFLKHILHRFIFLLQCSRVSVGYSGKLVAVV